MRFWRPGLPNTTNVHQRQPNGPHQAVAAWGRGMARSHKRGRLLVPPSKAEESGFCQGFSLVRREAKASFKHPQPIGPYGPIPYQVRRSERWRERRVGDLDSWPRMRPFLSTERSEAISLRCERDCDSKDKKDSDREGIRKSESRNRRRFPASRAKRSARSTSCGQGCCRLRLPPEGHFGASNDRAARSTSRLSSELHAPPVA